MEKASNVGTLEKKEGAFPGRASRAGRRIGQAAFTDGGYLWITGNAVTNRYGIPITTRAVNMEILISEKPSNVQRRNGKGRRSPGRTNRADSPWTDDKTVNESFTAQRHCGLSLCREIKSQGSCDKFQDAPPPLSMP